MKKFKIFSVLILSFLFCIALSFFSACDFFSYNAGISKEEQNNQENLADSKAQYIEKLEDVSSQDKYYDAEMRSYVLCLLEGKNEINDCENLEQLEEVYQKNVEIIKAIKTIADYEEEENLRQEALKNEKNEYIEKLNGVSAVENYREEEQVTYKFYLDAGIKAINDCADISLPEKIYLSYKETIENIKTAAQYEAEEEAALEEYKKDKVAEVDGYVDIAVYREEEGKTVKNLITEYSDKIADSGDYTEIDNLVRDFKIKIYAIKTDKELYAEELVELKDELKLNLAGSFKLSAYRENEGLEIQKLLKSFDDSLAKIIKKEDALSQYILVKGKLDAVKTSSILDAEDRVNYIEELYKKLSDNINNNFTDTERDLYLEKLETVKSDMDDRVSRESIRLVYQAFARELGTVDALKDELINYNDTVFYRENEQKQVDKIKDEYAAKFTENLNNENAKALLQEAKNAINEVKTNDDLWDDSLAKFRADLRALYGDEILEEPRSLTEANDYYELANIIDYYAFYQLSGTEFVCDTFRVKLNFAHNDAWTELVNVYWYCELIRTAVGITSYFENNSDYIVFELIPYNFASVSNDRPALNRLESAVEFDSDKSQMTARDEIFDDFAYYKYGRTINVWNSQQLWYALEHEYVPICAPNSPAELVMNRAKEILREIIMEGMSDEEKIFQIYTWFGRTGQYGYFQYVDDEKNGELTFYHLEGAILDQRALCYGFAKSFLLLSRIEGLDVYYVFGDYGSLDAKGFKLSSGHAYNFVKLQNNWYICDPLRSFYTTPNHIGISYLYYLIPAKNQYKFFRNVSTRSHEELYSQIDNNSVEEWLLYEKLNVTGQSIFLNDSNYNHNIVTIIDLMPKSFSVLCDNSILNKVEELLLNINQYDIHKIQYMDKTEIYCYRIN